jgi:predicted outer membrane repeat protein
MVYHHNKGIISHWINLFLCALFVALPFSSVSAQSSSNIIYVNRLANGANNGSSWANAYTRLDVALNAAQANDQIWIAQGLYYPTTNTSDRDASFVLKDQVSLYGGFAGTETSLSQRNINNYKVILSGDIDRNDNDIAGLVLNVNNIVGNNSNHVVVANNLQQGVLLDGVFITAGLGSYTLPNGNTAWRGGNGIQSTNSNLTLQKVMIAGNQGNNGAALSIDGGQVDIINSSILSNQANLGTIFSLNATVNFDNTSIQNNKATSGAAMANRKSRISLINSRLSGNIAETTGGAIFNSDATVLIVSNSSFDRNQANNGGAIYSTNDSQLTLEKATLNENKAEFNGGGISHLEGKLTINESQFVANTSNSGGALYYYNDTISNTMTLTNNSFSQNTAHYGGAIYHFQGTLALTNNVFEQNHAISTGGAIYNVLASATLTDNRFEQNSSDFDGGAIYNSSATMTLNNGQFKHNHSTFYGGSIANYISTVTLTNSQFEYNTARGGAAISNSNSVINISTSHFAHGYVSFNGAALHNSSSKVTLSHSDFISNTAEFYGGAIANSFNTTLIDQHTTALNNRARDGGYLHNDQSSSTITNATIQGNTVVVDGGAIYNSNKPDDSDQTSLILINTRLVQNNAGERGGALFNESSSAVLRNVEISANRASTGAAIYNDKSSPQLTNLTIAANYATNSSTIHNATSSSTIHNVNESTPSIRNTVIWGNHPEVFKHDSTSSAQLAYSLIEGCSPAVWHSDCGVNEGNNLNPIDPQFVSPVAASENPSTLGDYRPKATSPLIDQGNPAFNSEQFTLDGNERTIGVRIDIGAYEFKDGNQYTLQISSQPAAKGSVTIDPMQLAYSQNQQITLTAQANPGWAFDGWLGDIDANPNTPNRTLQVVKNHIITAKFRNLPPTANAGADQTVGLKSQVTLDASASADADPSQTLTYKWTQTAGPSVTLSSATAAKPTFTAPNSATTLTFSLVVTDNLGAVSSADTVIIRVLAPGQTPSYPVHLPFVRR